VREKYPEHLLLSFHEPERIILNQKNKRYPFLYRGKRF